MRVSLNDVSGDDQLALLVSKRDRMVSVYDKSGYLHATVTVVTDPDGSVSIGVGHREARTSVYIEHLDGDNDAEQTPEETVRDFNEWLSRNGHWLCTCGHELRVHRVDFNSCGECEKWEPIFCRGFNLDRTAAARP